MFNLNCWPPIRIHIKTSIGSISYTNTINSCFLNPLLPYSSRNCADTADTICRVFIIILPLSSISLLQYFSPEAICFRLKDVDILHDFIRELSCTGLYNYSKLLTNKYNFDAIAFSFIENWKCISFCAGCLCKEQEQIGYECSYGFYDKYAR